MRIKPAALLSSLVLCLTFSSSAQGANLVSNGGFETGDFTDWTVQGNVSSLFNVSSFLPHTGTYSMFYAELESDDDRISQVLSTTIGQQYSLAFWTYNLGSPDDNDGLRVFWEGSLALELVPLGEPIGQWVEYTLLLTASSNGSELSLRGFDAPLAFYMDDVSVTVVPETNTLLLAGAGLIILVLLRGKVVRRVMQAQRAE